MMSDSNPKIYDYIRTLEPVGYNIRIHTPKKLAKNRNLSLLDQIYSNNNNICNSGISLYINVCIYIYVSF